MTAPGRTVMEFGLKCWNRAWAASKQQLPWPREAMGSSQGHRDTDLTLPDTKERIATQNFELEAQAPQRRRGARVSDSAPGCKLPIHGVRKARFKSGGDANSRL